MEQQDIKQPNEVDAEKGKRGNPEDTSLLPSDQGEEPIRESAEDIYTDLQMPWLARDE